MGREVAGGGRIGLQEMVVGRGRRYFGQVFTGARRWKDTVAGEKKKEGKKTYAYCSVQSALWGVSAITL